MPLKTIATVCGTVLFNLFEMGTVDLQRNALGTSKMKQSQVTKKVNKLQQIIPVESHVQGNILRLSRRQTSLLGGQNTLPQ